MIVDKSEEESDRITYSLSLICSSGEDSYSGYLDAEFVSFLQFLRSEIFWF